jgi:hypothetical protein
MKQKSYQLISLKPHCYLDDEAITCLVKIGKSNIKLATLAFEKAITVNTYVDPEVLDGQEKKSLTSSQTLFHQKLLFALFYNYCLF